jgi:FkbM family methyltransferase
MPSTFLDLKNCVEQAGLSERIKVHNLALGTQESTAQMSLVDGLNSGKASVTLGGNIEIAMGRLERFYRAGIGLLKIDVEGFEEQVLSGAEQIIKEEKPFIIFESWADKKDPAGTLRPFEILARLGFSFFSPHYENGILSLSLFNHAERFSHREHMNVLAVHETRLEDFKSIF